MNMLVNMAHMQYHQDSFMLQLSCKFHKLIEYVNQLALIMSLTNIKI